jgi:hypothetical protein
MVLSVNCSLKESRPHGFVFIHCMVKRSSRTGRRIGRNKNVYLFPNWDVYADRFRSPLGLEVKNITKDIYMSDMVWTVQKCLRALRPLRIQVSKHREFDKEHDRIILNRRPRGVKMTYGSRNHNRRKTDDGGDNFDQILEACKEQLSEEICDHYQNVGQAFRQFMFQTYVQEDERRLCARSAFELGRCIVHTEGEYEEIEWHASLDMFGDRFRRWVALGTGVGTMIKHSYIYRHIFLTIIEECVDIGSRNIGRMFLRSLIEVLPEQELWDRIRAILRLVELTDDSMDALFERLKTVSFIGHEAEIVALLNKHGERYAMCDLEELVLTILKGNKKEQDFYFIIKLLELYFDRCETPSQRVVYKMLKRIPLKDGFVGLRRALQLYINYQQQSKWLSLTEKDTYNEQLTHSLLTLFKTPQLYVGLVEYLLPCYPDFAVRISSQFVSRGKVGLETVLWQDNLENKVMKEEHEQKHYNKVPLGGWTDSGGDTTEDPSDPETDISLELSPSTDRTLCLDEDDLSIIKKRDIVPFTKKRRSSSASSRPKKSRRHLSKLSSSFTHLEDDDISLIVA